MVPKMGRPAKAVREHVAPAFWQFIDEVIPTGMATSAVAARNGIGVRDERRALLGKSSKEVRYLNKLRSEKIVQPNPRKAWEVGEAAYALGPGHEWCASLLFVFAAGHLHSFALTLASAPEELLTRERKAELVRATRTACDPTVMRSEEDLLAELRANGIPDTVAHTELRRRRSGASFAVRPERNSWILTSEERTALHAAFLRPSIKLCRSYEIAIVTSRLAGENPGLGIDMQRDIALTSLQHAFAS